MVPQQMELEGSKLPEIKDDLQEISHGIGNIAIENGAEEPRQGAGRGISHPNNVRRKLQTM